MKVNRDIFKNIWTWISSRLPHRCKNWGTYWEDEQGRGLFCSVCWNVIEEEKYAPGKSR
jgi:hypothetical protein